MTGGRGKNTAKKTATTLLHIVIHIYACRAYHFLLVIIPSLAYLLFIQKSWWSISIKPSFCLLSGNVRPVTV